MKLPSLLFRPKIWGLSYLAWFIVLFILSSFSIKKHSIDLPTYSDKVAHFGYFSCGSFVLGIWLWLRFPKIRTILVATTVIAAAATVGIFDEWHQTFTPGRTGLDLGDWIADLSGGIAGFLAAHFIKKKVGRIPLSVSES
jgi:VanZ family protein